jgi:hypothetical protein
MPRLKSASAFEAVLKMDCTNCGARAQERCRVPRLPGDEYVVCNSRMKDRGGQYRASDLYLNPKPYVTPKRAKRDFSF